MRKVVMFNMISLDGFFEGLNQDIGWHQVDGEFDQFAIDQLSQAGGLIFGRLTYQLMAAYWPTPMAVENDPLVAGKMNALPKFVFSRTLDKVDWNNSQLIKGDAVTELKKLKGLPGNDMYIFGSANLSKMFIHAGLIDEYRIMVNPIVLGSGEPLFKENGGMLKMKLQETKLFGNGNVLLLYTPELR
jgi:dihydrofolate reductase